MQLLPNFGLIAGRRVHSDGKNTRSRRKAAQSLTPERADLLGIGVPAIGRNLFRRVDVPGAHATLIVALSLIPPVVRVAKEGSNGTGVARTEKRGDERQHRGRVVEIATGAKTSGSSTEIMCHGAIEVFESSVDVV